MLSLSSFSMVDYASDKKVPLTETIEIRESTKKFIEANHITLMEVVDLYWTTLNDNANYNQYKVIIIGKNGRREIQILKSDHSIVRVYLLT